METVVTVDRLYLELFHINQTLTFYYYHNHNNVFITIIILFIEGNKFTKNINVYYK